MNIIFLAILVVVKSLNSEEFTKDEFTKDVVFNVLATIYEGIDEAVRAGHNRYSLHILWQDTQSKYIDCSYCYYGIQDREAIQGFTDDVTKINYTTNYFTFPTSFNANIPEFRLDKERVFGIIMKDLVELFAGVSVSLSNDSCCHKITLRWEN